VNHELSAVGDSRQELLSKVDRIKVGSSTNLSGGLLEGVSQVVQSKSEHKVSSVMLLTDGIANEGITTTTGIVSAMLKLLGKKKLQCVYFWVW